MAYSNLLDRTRPIPTTQTYADVQPLLKWVYVWMFVGLLTTALVAFITVNTPSLLELRTQPLIVFGSIFLQLGLVIGLSWGIQRVSPGLAAGLYMIYAATMGFSLSLIFLFFDIGEIAIAFGTTSILFGIMSVVGFTTDVDLTRFRNLFFFGLIGLIVASLVNVLLAGGALTFIISIVGVILFMGLTAYDTQNIKRMAASPEIQGDGTMVARLSIFGALMLYLDFINIFLFLLQLMGGGGNE
ncbi:MAG: Bax inhibitor-1/YccA family protein [Chloroflexi bacterium]|nr:Bax inhibitor-1/YccA family protein [Chloroflexota bacterium]